MGKSESWSSKQLEYRTNSWDQREMIGYIHPCLLCPIMYPYTGLENDAPFSSLDLSAPIKLVRMDQWTSPPQCRCYLHWDSLPRWFWMVPSWQLKLTTTDQVLGSLDQGRIRRDNLIPLRPSSRDQLLYNEVFSPIFNFSAFFPHRNLGLLIFLETPER